MIARDFLRYHVAAEAVRQIGQWPTETTGSSPIIMRWKSGHRSIVVLRVNRPSKYGQNVQVTCGKKIIRLDHDDLLRMSPKWTAALAAISVALDAIRQPVPQ